MTDKLVIFDLEGAVLARPTPGAQDSPATARLVPEVIPALARLGQAGFRLVSLDCGHDAARTERTLELLASQGAKISQTLCCPHAETDPGCRCRKPDTGLVEALLADPGWERPASAVVGDTDEDLALATRLGVVGHLLGTGETSGGRSWLEVAHELIDRPRTASLERNTRETTIRVNVDLDARRDPKVTTGLGFFDHMLEQLGKHGGFALEIDCSGDLEVDEHHTVEDVALALGDALRQALGDKRGIDRYGFVLPMDETSAEVAIDLGGRPYLVFEGAFTRERVGDLPTELVPHFFRSLAQTLGAAVHIRVRGENNHHMIEACFKGFARALRQAIAREGTELPTTKGSL